MATEPGFGHVKHCTFLFNSQPYFLHPGNENEVAYVSTNGETVQRFTMSECGVRVANVSMHSAGQWQLGATSSTGVDASADFQLKIVPAVTTDEGSTTTVAGRPNDTVTIKCVPEDEDHGQHKYCEMWEIQEGHRGGEEQQLKREVCEWKTRFPRLTERRREIRCRTFSRGSMEAVVRKWTVVGQYEDTASDYLQGDSAIVLRCKNRSGVRLSGCYIRNQQTGTVHRISNGLMGVRYSSFRSNLDRGLCQFEIPKPFRADEVGHWLMQMVIDGQDVEQGRVDECMFTVSEDIVYQV